MFASMLCKCYFSNSRTLSRSKKLAKILLADDDVIACKQLKDLLELDNHVVDAVHSGNDALEYLLSAHFDLIILDWNMPGYSGPEVCRKYRSQGGKSPVLMLTAREEVDEKEEGFESGVDDYLTKPYHLKELMARLKALLRRPAVFTDTVLNLGGLCLDSSNHSVSLDGKDIKLLPLEFAILEFLMKRPGQPFSAEALLSRVWSTESDPSPEVVRTYIKTLRKKIQSDTGGPKINTVFGVGYKIDLQ